jgi:hypothetical protein
MSLRALPFFALAALSTTVNAQVVWDENTDGDITGDRFNPDFVTLAPGNNLLIATSGPDDREYIRLDVPNGFVLQALMLDAYVGEDGVAFIGVQAGTVFTEDHMGPNPANLLGYALFGTGMGNVATDILDDMGAAPGTIGFTPPLASGPYTYWIQNTGDLCTYQLNYVVAPVPEPASLVTLSLGTLALLRRRRRASA